MHWGMCVVHACGVRVLRGKAVGTPQASGVRRPRREPFLCVLLLLIPVPPPTRARRGPCPATQIPERLLMEGLDQECLGATGVVKDPDLWRRKEVKYNTRTHYTCSK